MAERKKTTRWRKAATADEINEVAWIDAEIAKLTAKRAALSIRRQRITNRANVRANDRGL